METYIKGNYKRSIYTSDNGFVIGIFKIKETNEENLKEFINKTITFTGQFVELNVDDTYFFYGEMVEHQKYGLQFKVNEYERVKPSDKDGIIEFLSSDLFNGIGEKIATQIVETLGENALDKILEEKSNLYLVPKLSSKKIDIIYNTLTKYEESHKTIVYLTELGFNMKDSLNIYNFYKSNTIIQIESNIFKIIDDIEEISFTKIDEISKKLNYKENDIKKLSKKLKGDYGKNGLEIENALKAYHQKQTIGSIIQVIDHDGFGGDIEIIIGINLQKEITGVEILSIDETVGLGMNAKNEEFRNQYVGKKVDHFQVVKNGKQNEDEVDSLSGATITSKAMTNGINGALDFYDLLKGR